jgi:hypothetical protein
MFPFERFKDFKVMKIQVVVNFTLKPEATWSSETSVSYKA